MMLFRVEYTKSALNQLKKLDKQTAFFILSYIEKNLVNCENPRLHGKSLQGPMSEKWRYRVGDYRILAKIEEDRVVILIVEVGHRKDIFGRWFFSCLREKQRKKAEVSYFKRIYHILDRIIHAMVLK